MSGPAGIIFSDLDGTFLDERYRPALDATALGKVTEEWRVVWVTSRTAAELSELRRMLSHADDAIGENGAICFCESLEIASKLGRASAAHDGWIVRLAADAPETRAAVDRAFRACGRRARTIADLTPGELAERSGYAEEDATRAQQRLGSVLLRDVNLDDAQSVRALGMLREEGYSVSPGGRWISVVKGADKGIAVRRWIEALGWKGKVIAIGNASNDYSLLTSADVAFVVRNEDGHHPDLAAIPGAHLLSETGTSGWNEMLAVLRGHSGTGVQ